MARNILVVEDDNNISNLIKMYLDKEGFDVRIAADGGKAVEEFKEKEPDLVLLDVMLPVLDGWGVCAKIRETSKCPIIMLTAKGEVNDRIHGLEMGADDYVVKPFEMKELLARINAVLRRSEIPEDTHKRLTFDKLIIDLDSYELIVDGKKIDTPPKELELLYHLGRWIYLIDAQDDLEEDAQAGRYNPVAARFGPQGDRETLERTLNHSLNRMYSAAQLLSFGRRWPVIENILYLGLPLAQRAVFEGSWKQIQKQTIWRQDQ